MSTGSAAHAKGETSTSARLRKATTNLSAQVICRSMAGQQRRRILRRDVDSLSARNIGGKPLRIVRLPGTLIGPTGLEGAHGSGLETGIPRSPDFPAFLLPANAP